MTDRRGSDAALSTRDDQRSADRRTVVLDPRVDAAAAIHAGERLAAGQLVAFATETVYGLGASIDHPDSVAAIFTAKGRPTTDPLIVHIADVEQIDEVADIPDALRELVNKLASRYWPGPLTLILPRRPDITPLVGGGRATVGVRLPAHVDARAAIKAAGAPVAAPSANRFGRISPTTVAHVLAELDGRIDAVLDGGPCPVGIESTVLDLVGPLDGQALLAAPRVLRPGAITISDIRDVCPGAVADPLAATATPDSPGQRLRHYAPDRMAILVSSDLLEATVERCERLGRPTRVVGRGTPAQVGPRLYDELRSADATDTDQTSVIVLIEPSDHGMGAAVLDRMWRAAEGRWIRQAADLTRLTAWLGATDTLSNAR